MALAGLLVLLALLLVKVAELCRRGPIRASVEGGEGGKDQATGLQSHEAGDRSAFLQEHGTKVR